ncbi:Non-specific serine/threonine protein kinase [Lentibacillus sp. JNUCC-1]|uniref:Stk1 family PASTA domain-containing Ser/Thr kinase n=1 Tax=Lentibacillus sp. JNUCC-1 TaxID=2654513 RepID=UPI0012E7C837|nr:Stk1 family PASTA domain-containing Ser/Thr kinase [Lentibacillus sp. JNUCC-1]MUV40015.1 Non-specific serine/threonine protein kinase [Lentibacillus sp. JNUCC-1]
MMEGHLLNERYRIKETIGGGGMANVYLARDIILERDVAIKVLRFEYANDEEFIARFDREAQSATSLSHPNIVSIYDVGEEDHILYMVMEHIDGMTLKEYIQLHGPLGVEEAISIMKQITSAISHAHANDIVHRDIKPQNILINTYGDVKVTDFGIAVALSSTALTQTNAVLGSVHYLSPEQARGGMATKKSDIYSLGIVLFELLTGRLPFSGQTPVAIALKHLQSETPSVIRFNPEVPQSVENIVLKATAKDPFHRYGNVYEMEQVLETALDPENLEAVPFVPPEEAGEETKAIPVITDSQYSNSKNDDTIVHKTDSPTKQVKPVSEKKKKPKKRKKWLWITLLLLFLIGGGVAAALVIPGMLEPDEAEIPDVVGMTYEEASDELEQVGLSGVEEEIYSDEVEKGLVVKTDPKVGRSIPVDQEVTILVSEGKEPVSFEDYTGQNFNQVERILNNKGYDDIMAIEKNSDLPEGEIIKQIQPDPDDKVIPEETRVIFDVSAGPEEITLINLKNMTEAEVNRYLDENNLKMNKRSEHSDTIPAGEVIRQSPSASTRMEQGGQVDVVFSSGPEAKPISTVYQTFTVKYKPNKDNSGEEETPQPQQVTIYIEDMERDMTHVAEQQEITEDTEFTIELTIEPGEKASYKVVRDEDTVIEKTVPYKEGE